MADYLPAVIHIGGRLDATRLTALLEAIRDDGVETAEGYGVCDEADLAGLLDGASPLVLVSPDASYGKLPAVEAACQQLGLTFSRASNAGYEYEAEIVSWAPDMAAPRWTQGSQDGSAVIAVSAVVRLLNELAVSDAEIVSRFRAELAEYLPVKVPPLVLVSTPM